MAPRMGWLDKVLDRIASEKDIIGRDGSPYLTRWVLFGKRFERTWHDQAIFAHRFHRSDFDHLHDHPWPFTSLILAGGYWEVTPTGRRWYGPGRVLRRPATWKHKVELEPGVEALTLVWRGHKVRHWGFWCPTGWKPWREYVANYDTGLNVCGE